MHAQSIRALSIFIMKMCPKLQCLAKVILNSVSERGVLGVRCSLSPSGATGFAKIDIAKQSVILSPNGASDKTFEELCI